MISLSATSVKAGFKLARWRRPEQIVPSISIMSHVIQAEPVAIMHMQSKISKLLQTCVAHHFVFMLRKITTFYHWDATCY